MEDNWHHWSSELMQLASQWGVGREGMSCLFVCLFVYVGGDSAVASGDIVCAHSV